MRKEGVELPVTRHHNKVVVLIPTPIILFVSVLLLSSERGVTDKMDGAYFERAKNKKE